MHLFCAFLPLRGAWSAARAAPGRRALPTRHAAELRHVLLALARTSVARKDAVTVRATSTTTERAARRG